MQRRPRDQESRQRCRRRAGPQSPTVDCHPRDRDADQPPRMLPHVHDEQGNANPSHRIVFDAAVGLPRAAAMKKFLLDPERVVPHQVNLHVSRHEHARANGAKSDDPRPRFSWPGEQPMNQKNRQQIKRHPIGEPCWNQRQRGQYEMLRVGSSVQAQIRLDGQQTEEHQLRIDNVGQAPEDHRDRRRRKEGGGHKSRAGPARLCTIQ